MNVRSRPGVDAMADARVQAGGGRGRGEARRPRARAAAPSGTEPVIRVMVEGEDAAKVRAHAEAIADAVRHAAQPVAG